MLRLYFFVENLERCTNFLRTEFLKLFFGRAPRVVWGELAPARQIFKIVGGLFSRGRVLSCPAHGARRRPRKMIRLSDKYIKFVAGCQHQMAFQNGFYRVALWFGI